MTPVNNIENSFAALNPTAAPQVKKEEGSGLDQADFMSLLVAQIENQDPTKPMDASQLHDLAG